ncbi:putative extracellular serine-rich protein [Aaosphaeria arxii CBS 175.79]|uniref:Putative extracellular serine-rich protein n=1 Tax=Aaosphaeria arxii CBS 175.79 TaxID=1450172 RepID=A0A6A5X6B0_9PLEO|nr:putative extracellular serine-rich protein [Aaosphaeria arxii CBS 175.79]KAF2008396.1 putative extracellular serine-rich protein [Aaosphaeria arxii CBS 175.79]
MAFAWKVSISFLACIATLGGQASAAVTVNSTILVIAREANATISGTAILQGYGIPYQTVDVSLPGGGFPQLNSTPNAGNFGGIVIVSAREYKGSDDWKAVLKDKQWNELYSYQEAFGVRLVRLNSWPSKEFGVEATGGTVKSDLPVSISDAKGFASAGLVVGAQMSTVNITKYPAKISDISLASEIARFEGTTKTTAAVINKFPSGREQQVWFSTFDPNFTSSTVLSHAWVQWLTRGLYLGFRRVYFNTQVDDVFVMTELYPDYKQSYRIKAADFSEHVAWMKEINAKLPAGSNYIIELGHNGNGNIEAAVEKDYDNNPAKCKPQEGVDYPAQTDGPPEYMKPIGTGKDLWDKKFKEYQWTKACSDLDPLETYFSDKQNMNAYFHVSHTFTHEDETNATYSDVVKEISWNQEWFKRIGFTDAKSSPYFSPNGLIPPGITGLHNGDAIRAWLENGIKFAVGDNSRPILMNRVDRKSDFHPIVTNVKENGYEGAYIIGRYGTSIYYNCDLPKCDNDEWKAIAGGKGDFQTQLDYERDVNSKYLLGLRWDPYMFHQANMRISDTPKVTLLGKNKKWSLLMAWTESVLGEVVRLTQWPIITLKHDDVANAIINRKTRDECLPNLSYQLSDDRKSITGLTVNARNTKCATALPVTVPGNVVSDAGATKEQVGKDPLTLWVTLGGSARSYNLGSSIKL